MYVIFRLRLRQMMEKNLTTGFSLTKQSLIFKAGLTPTVLP